MGILQTIPYSKFNYKGRTPNFNKETPGSTLHHDESTLGIPKSTRKPSQLDESKTKDKYKPTNTYSQNLPK